MKNQLLLVALFVAIISCSFSGKSKNYKFEGKWSETWGVGQKTDVDYNDRYTITKNPEGVSEITCQTNEFYRFIDISIRKNQLTFKIINTSGNDTLPYSLQISKKGDKMKGTAYSVRGEKTNIEWIREAKF
ncbi:MAG: hypothetical protein ABIQ40_20230 [Bacteroidia bacterium]